MPPRTSRKARTARRAASHRPERGAARQRARLRARPGQHLLRPDRDHHAALLAKPAQQLLIAQFARTEVATVFGVEARPQIEQRGVVVEDLRLPGDDDRPVRRRVVDDERHVGSVLKQPVLDARTGDRDAEAAPRVVEPHRRRVRRVLALAPVGRARRVPPRSLLLDGQQRMTSLYQVTLRGKVVETVTPKKKKVKRWFYIDIRKALNPSSDREEAIVGVPEDRVVRTDFGRETVLDVSSAEKEYSALMYPVSQVFDWDRWQDGFDQYWRGDQNEGRRQEFRAFKRQVLENFKGLQGAGDRPRSVNLKGSRVRRLREGEYWRKSTRCV